MPHAGVSSRLLTWLAAGANPRDIPSDDFASTFSFEDGGFRIAPPLAMEHLQVAGGAALVDVSLLATLEAPASLVCVLRGRDPVTEMWHQCAWVFLLERGKVQRALLTLSAQVPPRPYDGSLPLREAQ